MNGLLDLLSNPLTSLIAGFLLGILGSFIFWSIQVHIAPKVRFGEVITKYRAEETKSGYKDRIQFWNNGCRNIIDVEIFARLIIRGLDPNFPDNFSSYSIPLGYDRLPIILPETASEKALDKIKVSRRHKVRLDVAEIEELKDPGFAEYIINNLRGKKEELYRYLEERKQHVEKKKKDISQGSALSMINDLVLKEEDFLEKGLFPEIPSEKAEEEKRKAIRDLIERNPNLLAHFMTLAVKDQAWLEIAIFGYDEYSGTRKVFTKIYTRDKLKVGAFTKPDLKWLFLRRLCLPFVGQGGKAKGG